jgi:predicted nucleotide-binding protein (sugar kinase/HSP70/actin superfamily)
MFDGRVHLRARGKTLIWLDLMVYIFHVLQITQFIYFCLENKILSLKFGSRKIKVPVKKYLILDFCLEKA